MHRHSRVQAACDCGRPSGGDARTEGADTPAAACCCSGGPQHARGGRLHQSVWPGYHAAEGLPHIRRSSMVGELYPFYKHMLFWCKPQHSSN